MNNVRNMMNGLDIDFPPELVPYRDIIEATLKPYIEIEVIPNPNLTLWQSKFGGFPYLSKTVDYPTNPDGKYLRLLAQIDFSEVPPLENFPERGILQFYINCDRNYGINYHCLTEQGGFRVLYFPEPERNNIVTNFDFLPEIPQNSFPIAGEFSLLFTKRIAPVSVSTYAFRNILTALFFDRDEERYYELLDWYEETFPSCGHRLGGYPHFIQFDPRQQFFNIKESYNVLLLQIDTDFKQGYRKIMWGDTGVGNFFIQSSKLKQLDFTDVLYNWDCC